MSKNHFCTIITENYLPYAIALFQSLQQQDANAILSVLIVDGSIRSTENEFPEGLNIVNKHELSGVPFSSEIEKKYFNPRKNDRYRWSMKPVFLNFLISKGFKKVIYLDSDLYFFSSYQFLFDYLDKHTAILTPHWRSLDVSGDLKDFTNNYTNGFFNGGFVGVNENATELLIWWAKMCYHKCERNYSKCLYDDQGYLSLFPLIDENVKIIHHRGCNVASWNDIENKRINVNGEIKINGKYPIVFIHFSEQLFKRTINGKDTSLQEYLFYYLKQLIKNGVKPKKDWIKWLNQKNDRKNPNYE